MNVIRFLIGKLFSEKFLRLVILPLGPELQTQDSFQLFILYSSFTTTSFVYFKHYGQLCFHTQVMLTTSYRTLPVQKLLQPHYLNLPASFLYLIRLLKGYNGSFFYAEEIHGFCESVQFTRQVVGM